MRPRRVGWAERPHRVGFAVHELIDRIGKDSFYSDEQASGSESREKPTLATMTDGNHGRAVARVAQKLGCDCVIYVPEIMSNARCQTCLILKDFSENPKLNVNKVDCDHHSGY